MKRLLFVVICIIIIPCYQVGAGSLFRNGHSVEAGDSILASSADAETLNAGFVGAGSASSAHRPQVPEPVFLVILGVGLISLAAGVRRKLQNP